MNVLRVLYRAEQLPVFQNRMFQTPEEAINCAKGDIVLVQDMETGLIFNQAFIPELMQRDNYEEWKIGGKKKLDQKATDVVSKRLAEYEKPDIDPSVERDLAAYIHKRTGR